MLDLRTGVVLLGTSGESFLHPSCKLEHKWGGQLDSFALSWRLIVCALVAFVGGTMSASVGVGGGGVYVPALLLIACLPPEGAIPVSKVCILGVAVTTFFVNMRKRHPKADRPLINYSVAFLMAPTTILGTVFGIMMFVVFPSWLILILLILVLGVTCYRTFTKAVELHKKEEAAKKDAEVRGYDDAEVQGPTDSLIRGVNSDSPVGSEAGDDTWAGHRAAYLLQKEARTPIHKICALVFLWLSMILIVFVRGGGEGRSNVSGLGIVKCSWQFALLTVALVIILCSGAAAGWYLQWRRTKQLREAGVPNVEGDIEWTIWKFLGFVGVGCFAGTCAGFLGIGSGMINVPYMLEIGMQPEVAAATSSFIIVFTALSTVVQYAILGLLPLQSAAFYGCLGLISAVVGQIGVAAIVKKYKKSSIVSFLLGGVISVSAIGLIIQAILTMVESSKNHTLQLGFKPYCPKKNATRTHAAEAIMEILSYRWEL